MSNLVLQKTRTLKPLTDDATTDAMLTILVGIPPEQQDSMWIREQSGSVCMFKHDKFPGKVIEYVQGTADDSVTTLYEENPIFTSLRSLKETREELINEIGTVLLALPSTVIVEDEGRGRAVHLRELGLAQLQDVLAHFTGTDLKTL